LAARRGDEDLTGLPPEQTCNSLKTKESQKEQVKGETAFNELAA
jgi:hypothetical protein